MSASTKIKALLIDPFQHEIYSVMIEPDSGSEVAKLLDCDLIQVVRMDMFVNGIDHVAWVDESGLLREPFVYPHFVIKTANGGQPMAGYGLITGLGNVGQMVNCQMPLSALSGVLLFEPWRSRIPIDNVIDQMLRLYKVGE